MSVRYDENIPGRRAHFLFWLSESSRCRCSIEKEQSRQGFGWVHIRNIRQIRLKHTYRPRSKHTWSTVETYLERGQNIPGARSKRTSSTVETYLEHGWNIPRARSKHASSTVEIYLEHGRNIPRARLKHTSITVEIYLENGQNIPRARSKRTSSTVETWFEQIEKWFLSDFLLAKLWTQTWSKIIQYLCIFNVEWARLAYLLIKNRTNTRRP